jgi:hypothetical protein
MEIITTVLSKEREESRRICEAIVDSEQNYLFTNNTLYKNKNSEVSTASLQGDDPNQQMQN